jgi:LysR family transcriptional regulator, transcription activator of glutamate synthase operon
MQMDWMYAFLETAEQHSLSKASDKLNLSQAALSKQIRNLEQTLGVALFHRSAAGMSLTLAGEHFLQRIQPWLAEFQVIVRDMASFQIPECLIIGALPSLAAHYLPDKIAKMTDVEFDMDIRIYNTSPEILEALSQGQLDAALMECVKPLPKVFWSARLFDEPYYVVLPISHRLGGLSEVFLTDLVGAPFIAYPPKCDVRASVFRAFAKLQLEPNVVREIPFGESILGFVAAGMGLTIVPQAIATHVDPRTLRALPIRDFDLNRTVCLAARSHLHGKRLLREFQAKHTT